MIKSENRAVGMVDSVIRLRIKQHIKSKAEKLFKKMGLTMNQVVNLFLHEVTTNEEVKNPSKLTKTSIAKLKKDWKKYA